MRRLSWLLLNQLTMSAVNCNIIQHFKASLKPLSMAHGGVVQVNLKFLLELIYHVDEAVFSPKKYLIRHNTKG
eukprot:14472872-Ditylum_brightwellii.AAC.1